MPSILPFASLYSDHIRKCTSCRDKQLYSSGETFNRGSQSGRHDRIDKRLKEDHSVQEEEKKGLQAQFRIKDDPDTVPDNKNSVRVD